MVHHRTGEDEHWTVLTGTTLLLLTGLGMLAACTGLVVTSRRRASQR